MLSEEAFEPSRIEWRGQSYSHPSKPTPTFFCVDSRKQNFVTKEDVYPIPHVAKCIELLGKAAMFSTLNSNSKHGKVDIKNEDRGKIAFTSHNGLYRFARMPFQFWDAASTSQRTMHVSLSAINWQFRPVYLEDIFVFPSLAVKHIDRTRHLLTLLSDAKANLKLRKCYCFTGRMDQLDHVLLLKAFRDCASYEKCLQKSKSSTEWYKTEIEFRLCYVLRRFLTYIDRNASPSSDKYEWTSRVTSY